MPRQPRPDLPGITQHLVQRGNDRQPCFYADVDYSRYLQDLHAACVRYGVALHAYVLMTNHVHLLVTSQASGAIGRMMQCLGRHYVTYVNRTYRRTGTLWEGRYKSCLVDGDRYVLACHRYIELNPVRAAMVAAPDQYPWSSHLANAHGHDDPRLSLHPILASLASTRELRQRYYQALFDEVLDEAQMQEIRTFATAASLGFYPLPSRHRGTTGSMRHGTTSA